MTTKKQTAMKAGFVQKARPAEDYPGLLGKLGKLKYTSSGIRSETERQALREALDRMFELSVSANAPYTITLDITPGGSASVADASAAVVETVVGDDPASGDGNLDKALERARARGQKRAAEILAGPEMQSSEEFGELLGLTRVSVNEQRKAGKLLGLERAQRGYRYPSWQLDSDGRPYPQLAALNQLLGSAWAVYRFLMQPHPELDGLSGKDALHEGMGNAVVDAARSVAQGDFR